MIRLYRNYDKFSKGEVVWNCETFFKARVAADSLDKLSLDVMCNIDKAKLLDKDLGTIQTPFGVTDIEHLSTGCKIVLSYIFMSKNQNDYDIIKALDATEAGWNALEELFKAVEILKYDIGIIIQHDNDLYECSDRKYLVDDVEIIDTLYDF